MPGQTASTLFSSVSRAGLPAAKQGQQQPWKKIVTPQAQGEVMIVAVPTQTRGCERLGGY